jgi:hypothetical protein
LIVVGTFEILHQNILFANMSKKGEFKKTDDKTMLQLTDMKNKFV